MSGLSEADRQSLLTDALGLAYDNMHSPWAQEAMFSAIEAIVTRAVNEALTDAADAIWADIRNQRNDGATKSWAGGMAWSAQIVRARTN